MGSDARNVLNDHGSNKANAMLEREEVIVKDTIFVDPAASVSDADIFGSDAKDPMYKNVSFPVTSHAFSFTHIRVVHNMAFTPSDPKRQNSYIQHFEENSRLHFELETHVIGNDIPISLLVKNTWMALGSVSATGTYIQPVAKMSEWYKLESAIELGAGKQFKVKFIAAKSLTAQAYSASDTPFVPNAGANLTCPSSGHWIQVYLRGLRYIEAR